MNPVTFNYPFASMFKALKMETGVLDSPLLIWECNKKSFTEEEMGMIYDKNGLRMPFPCFRVSNDAASVFFIQLDSNKIHVYVYTKLLPSIIRFFNIVLNCEENHPSGYISRNATAYAFNLKTGQIAVMSNKEKPNAVIEDDINTVIANTLMLCVDFQNPHLHLCKKTPPIPQGHSVAWQKAREHYVLIHKTHPANRAENAGKKLITDGPIIDRCAHSRRAHFRMLRSPKFKNKQGQRIWIKSIWVGPKEWTDHSGQIYKIVEN